MTNPNDLAFPNPAYNDSGLTKREWFAGMIIQGVLANDGWIKAIKSMTRDENDALRNTLLSHHVVVVADSLIAELNKESI